MSERPVSDKPVSQPTIAQPQHEIVPAPIVEMKKHLEAVAVIAKDLPNSDELAAFTASLLAATRQLDDVKAE